MKYVCLAVGSWFLAPERLVACAPAEVFLVPLKDFVPERFWFPKIPGSRKVLVSPKLFWFARNDLVSPESCWFVCALALSATGVGDAWLSRRSLWLRLCLTAACEYSAASAMLASISSGMKR